MLGIEFGFSDRQVIVLTAIFFLKKIINNFNTKFAFTFFVISFLFNILILPYLLYIKN